MKILFLIMFVCSLSFAARMFATDESQTICLVLDSSFHVSTTSDAIVRY